MEELQDPCLAERTRKGGPRSTRGCGARTASSAAVRMEDYSEIFGGFASSCSIPVLVLPEAMEGYEEALLESQSMNYSEIFGDIDTGTFPLSYEELLSAEKGSKDGDDRFQEVPNGGQFEKAAFELHLEAPIGEHIKISKLSHASSTFDSSLNTEQLNFSGRTSHNIVDEVKSTRCSSGIQSNYEPYFEAETSTGFVEDDENPKNIARDDHILSGYMEEEEEKGGKDKEFLNTRFVSAPVDGSENDLKNYHEPSKYSPSESKDEDLKQHSRSSSYHSTSSGDVALSDYSFLTISDINLHTQPLQVPPPSRAPPKLDMKQEMPKSEAFEASNFSEDLIPETYKSYHGRHVGVPRTRHALKETAKGNSPIHLNVEVDASSAAAASAAAIVEAMEQAQASLKCAKELMERNRESPQSGRKKTSHDFDSWNEHNISFAGRLRHKTPKIVQKVLPNQVERANSVFSEHDEEAIQGKESRFSLFSGERERSHEWKIDKQFYELVGREKLMRTGVISDEKYSRDEATPSAHQFFPERKTYGMHRKIISHSDNDTKVEKLNKYISEKKLYTGGELEVQDRNATHLKFGNTIENEEILDVLKTSDVPSVEGDDDEDKQKVGRVIHVFDESKSNAEDDISLIKHGWNEKELKECQESSIRGVSEKNEDDNKDLNSNGRNDSGLTDFSSGSKLGGFGGKAVGMTLGRGTEFDEIYGTSIASDHDALTSAEHMAHSTEVFNYNSTSAFKKYEVKFSSLQKANEVEVEKECRKSFSSDKEKNLEDMRDECQLGQLNNAIRESYMVGYNEGKYFQLKDFDNISEKDVNGKLSETNKTSELAKNEKKLKHDQSAKLNAPNGIEEKVAKLSFQPDLLANAKNEFELQQNEEEKKVHALPLKFENFVDKLTANMEQRKGDKHLVGKVQAAFELEKKIKRLTAGQEGLQRIRVQDDEAIQQAKSESPSANASRSSLKQMEKSIPDEWRDTKHIQNEMADSKIKEAEQKRKLEEERAREREKDRIAVEKTSGSCEKVFPESRERPERSEKYSAEAFERSERVSNEAKLRAERAAVERATAEARERAIERALAEQASLGARRQAETLSNVSEEKARKHNTSEGIVRPGEDSKISLKPASIVCDAPVDANSQSAGLEEESPLRCKARKERHQRIVERAAKALAEKNMRDLLAQKEQSERNRLAESLDAEVKRWSNGKEGNLRALLSTLQYILGHDSGWQPIPLTEVITASAVRKAYRKATLYVHPDKLQQRGAIIQHKYICEKVFDLLKDAWNKFNSEGP